MSSTGRYQIVTSFGGYFNISADYGNTWTASSVLVTNATSSAAISSTGQYMVTYSSNGSINVSTNFGATFTTKENIRGWRGIAMSASGQYMFIGVFNGGIYRSLAYPAPNLTISTGTTGTNYAVVYDISNNLTYYNTSKTFVVPHPTNAKKYLVHACLEGPEAGVYYRGEATIENNEYIEIELPSYVEKLANNFTVHVTSLCSNFYYTSRVVHNKFKVFGKNGSFNWIVYGRRLEIEVEPEISSVNVKGSGPYKWI
jgi:hypothetical protein